MLEHLELENVGPAPEMALDLAPRMNLITGDNGLGKSFLLDVAWCDPRRWNTRCTIARRTPDVRRTVPNVVPGTFGSMLDDTNRATELRGPLRTGSTRHRAERTASR